MKRTIIVLWMALFTMTMVAQGTGWLAGTGTLNDPYQIKTAQELETLAANVNAGNAYKGVYFKMTADVNLSTVCGMSLNKSWSPIGAVGKEGFCGVFDGADHVISGLYIKGGNDKQGLFGFVNGGMVRRCVVRGASVSITGDYTSGAIIVGVTKNATIEDCIVEDATLSGNFGSNLGFIVGKMSDSRLFGNYVTNSVLSGGAHNGAICGRKSGKSMLQKNRFTASVMGVSGGCNGKNINNSKNYEGAVLTTEPMREIAAISAETVTPEVEELTPKASVKEAQPSASQAPGFMYEQLKEGERELLPSENIHEHSFMQIVNSLKKAPTTDPLPKNLSYIVKTKDTKKTDRMIFGTTGVRLEGAETTGFLTSNFRYYSMCDWYEGMRFMVVPDKCDLLVSTFRDARNNKAVSSGSLRYKIMIYKGHETASNGREHVFFTCRDDGKEYYYELPLGHYDDYCYSRKGVPTLAYLDDVDRARALLLNHQILTRSSLYRIDDPNNDDEGYKEVNVQKNIIVTVKAVGVGTRDFPVKIVVEDEQGNQFYQCVAMSGTNCSLRDDEFGAKNERFLFLHSFDYADGIMPIEENLNNYIGTTVHTNHHTSMRSRGSGKMRVVKVPRFTGFIIDEIEPLQNSRYYTLTMREAESRRVYHKDVAFNIEDVTNTPGGNMDEDFFGYVFGMGEGATKETSKETRTAIREGRVIRGMKREEVEMAMGEPFRKLTEANGEEKWMYSRSNGVILDVWFYAETGLVREAKARLSAEEAQKRALEAKKKGAAKRKAQEAARQEANNQPVLPFEEDKKEQQKQQ